jgi:predicted RNase H-like HicB family nuclease
MMQVLDLTTETKGQAFEDVLYVSADCPLAGIGTLAASYSAAGLCQRVGASRIDPAPPPVAVDWPQRSGDGMNYTLDCEREDDGQWLAEVLELPGVLAYGATQEEAMARAEALALRVLAERLEQGEARATAIHISIPAAA